MPFILTGCLIFFYNVVQPYFPNILPNLSAVSNYTFSMLSLLVAFMMVYQEMGSLKHRNYQVVGGLTGICAYILAMKGTTVDGVYSVTWNRFGPTGIVVAICIGLYVSIIFHLIAKLNLFKNNNTIPEFVQEWIKNIIPIFLSIRPIRASSCSTCSAASSILWASLAGPGLAPATPSSSPHRLLMWLLWQPAALQCT